MRKPRPAARILAAIAAAAMPTIASAQAHEADGRVGFNAFAIVSYVPADAAYTIRTYAMGRSGDYSFALTDEGFVWEIPAGPATIRYTAVVGEGTWHEVGDRVLPGQDPVRFFEMDLVRMGDSDWPAGGAVTPE